MKKIWSILVFFIVCLSVYGQRNAVTHTFNTPLGTDTTVYHFFWTENSWGVSFNYTAFDAADAVLDLGETFGTTDGSIFNRLDNPSLPYIMVDSSMFFEKQSYNFEILAIKLTRNSVSAGLPLSYRITRNDAYRIIAMESITWDEMFAEYNKENGFIIPSNALADYISQITTINQRDRWKQCVINNK